MERVKLTKPQAVALAAVGRELARLSAEIESRMQQIQELREAQADLAETYRVAHGMPPGKVSLERRDNALWLCVKPGEVKAEAEKAGEPEGE